MARDDVAALTAQSLGRYGDRWQACGRVSIRHLADFGWLLMCHVAQSWAATWHPVVGSWFCIKLYGFTVGRTPDLFSGQRTGRAGLTTRATFVLTMNRIKNISELKSRFRRRRKGPGLSPSPRFNKQCHMTTTAGVYAIGASPRIPCGSHTTRAIPTKRARG